MGAKAGVRPTGRYQDNPRRRRPIRRSGRTQARPYAHTAAQPRKQGRGTIHILPAEYARALFLAEQTDTSDDAIDALVAARLRRRAIFDRPDPPDVVVVLDEAVLHRLIGSPQVMHDALVYVAELSRRPCIVVQVIPASNGANAGLGGAFYIAAADGMAETLQLDGVEEQTTEKRALVRKAAVAFDRVRGDALPRDASRDLVLKVADEQWKP